jgi:hypothetical protein
VDISGIEACKVIPLVPSAPGRPAARSAAYVEL